VTHQPHTSDAKTTGQRDLQEPALCLSPNIWHGRSVTMGRHKSQGKFRILNSRQAQRQRSRASALRDQASAYEAARAELGKIYEDGGRNRFHYVIRRDLVHARRVSSAAAPQPSPAAALAPLKGWALHLYLIAIFDAQSRRPAGTNVDNTRPLCRANNVEAGWADLLPAVTTTTDRRAGMRRQAVHAWNLLEREKLAVISGQPGVAGRYNHVQLLDETGSGAPDMAPPLQHSSR
jgi:hypothetical protein